MNEQQGHTGSILDGIQDRATKKGIEMAQNQAGELIASGQITQLPLPTITPKDGWKTSQGQMTAAFLLITMLSSFFGWKSLTPDKIENIYQMVVLASIVLGPLLAAVMQLRTYTNSRGKITSNAIWATSAMNKDNPDLQFPKLLGPGGGREEEIEGLPADFYLRAENKDK